MKRFWIIGALGLALITSTHAAEVLRSAYSGKPTLIRRYFSRNADCSYKLINVDITASPKHGKVEPKFGDYELTAADVRGGDIGACAGKSIRVVELHYTSDKEFLGQDAFSVRATSMGMPTITDDYTIDVRLIYDPLSPLPPTRAPEK
jgi:hypothetical protein